MFSLLRLLICLFGLSLFTGSAFASDAAAVTWRLLDYLAVDYGGAVADGEVVSASEYAEMQEFSETIETKLAALPAARAQPELVDAARALRQLVTARAPADEVGRQAHALADRLVQSYPIARAPASAPDLARGEKLYAEHCAACHGAHGAGDGPAAAAMQPPPIDFTDAKRASQRSLFALYQVIDQGLDGTPMQSFAQLPVEDRWALAFHVGRFAFPADLADAGRKRWEADEPLRGRVLNLEQLVRITPAALAAETDEDTAHSVTAYLRGAPQAAIAGSGTLLALSRERLAQTVAAYRAGDRKSASEQALSAYIDGFEPVEPMLRGRDPELLGEVEKGMLELRSRLQRGADVEAVSTQAAHIESLFDRTELALSHGRASAAAAFVGAFTILLREGLEALLIVVAIIAFLRKAGRLETMRYVHAGWIGALIAGFATWALATYAIDIAGAQREVTEGLASLFAVVMLIGVGLWMHQKSLAGRWQQYLTEKLSHALSTRSAWILFTLCFISVYREVFETILFYAAMWNPDTLVAIVAGFASAVVALALITWAMLGFSRRLPIGTFFSVSSLFIALLAFVLTGKGVAALQEAGWVGVDPLAFVPRIDLLGISPSMQVVGAQILTLFVVVAGLLYNRASAKTVS
ncbi:high-affinity iron transporter [Panacagrimonas perspica]|uniref:High-affinity iron transporter n=1 Tax=Panacagrimonas perspica TaxID=381431 RepID=A0A4S3KBQ9_9GAMM|nr:FTR1 family protein [Panacagrimonas perspica]TDU32761.1 high-affinity iron transporter [Panacagrimonas perspica]THD05638.1 iron permease [Panacagrimonas perspica]